MYWHAGPPSAAEARYLVRTTPTGAETSLGPQTPENQAIYELFMQRKRDSLDGGLESRAGPTSAPEPCTARGASGDAMKVYFISK